MVAVRFDGRLVNYDRPDLDELVLAYASSIHKAQGSEYPCVLLPIHTQHYVMLQRNLLYTGMTRGRRLVVLIGTRRALAIAVKNDRIESRFTQLASQLGSRQPKNIVGSLSKGKRETRGGEEISGEGSLFSGVPVSMSSPEDALLLEES